MTYAAMGNNGGAYQQLVRFFARLEKVRPDVGASGSPTAGGEGSPEKRSWPRKKGDSVRAELGAPGEPQIDSRMDECRYLPSGNEAAKANEANEEGPPEERMRAQAKLIDVLEMEHQIERLMIETRMAQFFQCLRSDHFGRMLITAALFLGARADRNSLNLCIDSVSRIPMPSAIREEVMNALTQDAPSPPSRRRAPSPRRVAGVPAARLEPRCGRGREVQTTPLAPALETPRTLDDAQQKALQAAAPAAGFYAPPLAFEAYAAMTPDERGEHNWQTAQRNTKWIAAALSALSASWIQVDHGNVVAWSPFCWTQPLPKALFDDAQGRGRLTYVFMRHDAQEAKAVLYRTHEV
jgi:hypothetical protein